MGVDATHLLDGMPQAGQISGISGGEARYLVRAASSHADLSLSLSPLTAGCGAHVHGKKTFESPTRTPYESVGRSC